MMLCLRGKVLPLASQIFKEVAPVCRKSLSSPLTMKFCQRPLTSPVLNVFALNVSARLHTSSQCQKKKRWEEGPLRSLLRNQWQEIRKTPKPAFVIACAGSVPFVTVPIVMSATQFYLPEFATAQILYGACVLAFLGGVRWGITLPDNILARPNWSNLATGVLYPYMAFICLLMKDDIEMAMLGLGAGFFISLMVDILGLEIVNLSPITPVWYLWMRGLLTVFALLSFLATVICYSTYPLYQDKTKQPQVKKNK
ncbi:transmembrane protein 69 [Hyperolius riggenbachi]|uniref:transmembrane protein 69 n=1 Tax=Hyperolius riggenbachi TaxID=752182 RepID=UPI0035A2F155